MALTMTRTRTQTTLTKLATQLANINGELAFISELQEKSPAHTEVLQARAAQLERHRAALVLTLKQFDPTLDAEKVGTADTWQKAFRARTPVGLMRRYLGANLTRWRGGS